MKSWILLPAVLAAAAACGPASDDPPPATPASPSVYAAALSSPERLPGDADQDATRKPDEVLAFLGIEPGMTVLEMFAGSGYYTEVLSRVVGDAGRVHAQTNTPSVNFAGEQYVLRHSDDRLPNVEILFAENNALELEADTYDAATIILNFHDLYWESEQYGWEKIDAEAFLGEVFSALKPGGVFGVVDHSAAPGSGSESAPTLHRIDRDFVVERVTAAGFELDGESDILRNADDDPALTVFDPSVRGRTDRFVLRFRKPE